ARRWLGTEVITSKTTSYASSTPLLYIGLTESGWPRPWPWNEVRRSLKPHREGHMIVRMKSASLVLATAVCTAAMMSASAASDPGTPINGAQMVDAFEGTFGVHAGQRRNHIKGTCAAGEFTGTSEAAALSRSPIFSGKSIPVVARFSLGGGNPDVPDAAPAPR